MVVVKSESNDHSQERPQGLRHSVSGNNTAAKVLIPKTSPRGALDLPFTDMFVECEVRSLARGLASPPRIHVGRKSRFDSNFKFEFQTISSFGEARANGKTHDLASEKGIRRQNRVHVCFSRSPRSRLRGMFRLFCMEKMCKNARRCLENHRFGVNPDSSQFTKNC